jgi:hypothetical protein
VNASGVIAPYRYEGMWLFDDPAAGLHREPFVAGIDKMIDQLVASIPDAHQGFRLIFSAAPFPGHTVKLGWQREESRTKWPSLPKLHHDLLSSFGDAPLDRPCPDSGSDISYSSLE